MDNLKDALAHLNVAMIKANDEAQDDIEQAIEGIKLELRERAEAPDAADDICYHCRHMCGIRRQYVGGVMLKCVGYEKGETNYD
jgi:hypothetical protein